MTSRSFFVNWTGTSTDIAQFEIQYKPGAGSSWQDFATSTASSTQTFNVPQDEITYYFRGHASSTAGVLSDWAQIEAPINWQPVVINEVAWAGTGTSSKARNDEWIELFNDGSAPVNLAGWALMTKGGQKFAFNGRTIGTGEYLLLSRGETKLTLHNTDGALALYDTSGKLADEAQFPATVIKPFVKYKLDLLRYDGDETKAAGSYTRFQERLAEIELAENNGQRFSFKPNRRPDTTTNLRHLVELDSTSTEGTT